MTLKKAFALFLCAIMLLTIFFGPGMLKKHHVNVSEGAERRQKSSEWTGVITLWDFPRLNIRTGLRLSWIKEKIRAFEKNNPGVYVELRELDWREGATQLKASAQLGVYPDIAPVGSDYYYISKGMLEPLDDSLSLDDRNDFTDAAIKAVSYNGKIYGLPWMMTGYTLLLNTDIFKERNINLPVDGNWTFDQFVESLKHLTYDTNRRGGPDVFGFNSFIENGAYNIFGILMCDGAQMVDSDTGAYAFYYPEALSGLKKLCSLKNTYGVTHPGFGKMSENQAWASFLSGKVAVYAASTWAIPYLRNMQENSRINFAVANFPTGSEEMPLNIGNNTCAYAIFKQTDEKKRKMCMAFIKSLTASDNQKELVDFGYFPVRKSAKYLYENDKEMYTIQQSMRFSEPLPRLQNWHDIDLVLQTKIKAAVNGELTPEQALLEAQEQIERRMK